VQPSEFWGMTLQEFYLLYDAKRGHDPEQDYAGGMTEDSVRDLYRQLKGGS